MTEISVLHRVARTGRGEVGPKALYTVTPDELKSYLRSRQNWKSRLPEKKMEGHGNRFLLTFDDGYENNLTEALPVLEDFDAEAIIFITTGFVEGSVYPYEFELASVIEDYDALRVNAGDPLSKTQNLISKRSLYQSLRRPLKADSHQKRNAFLDRLAKLNNYDRERFQNEAFLSWESVLKLDRHPLVTIGAHTETHPVLTRRFPWVAYHEMKTSKRKLERMLGHDILHFSYPYGRNNSIVRNLARWAGFLWAFTTESRRIDDLGACDPMALPRMDIQQLV